MPNGDDDDYLPRVVSNRLIWDEIKILRAKVEALSNKVMIMFGTISAISVAIALYELLVHK